MRTCFVMDYPTRTIGGAQTQCELIGNGLAAKGWDIVYVRSDAITTRRSILGMLRVKTFPTKWLAEFLHAVSLIRLLKRLNPQVIIVPYASPRSEAAILYSLLYGKKIVFRAGSILDVDLTFARGTGWHEFGFVARLLHSLTVRNAHAIVANAAYIAKAFNMTLPRKGVWIIRNGQNIELRQTQKPEPSHVLWIGTMSNVKNPAVFVKLARELPEIEFVMCGDGPLFSQVSKEAQNAPNLVLAGLVSGQIKRMFLETSYAIVNTSLAEGFPNTLIEAGVHMIPYISFVDPDEVICRHNLGFHVKSLSELVRKTKLVVEDSSLRRGMGIRIRSYVEKEHNLEGTVSEYDKLLRSLCHLTNFQPYMSYDSLQTS